ncbi:hypothetical protein N7492_010686 [Penicillium capsulatum]|uniref:Uncharacterized protein n=1 Tax=Penicillium capsulatum TaxID=69766 RepID=A0A9W9LE60_9EURO|nr:hypothetical protein N7492_010686 [Penicillium capsulatum]KAJ6113184.1 hypothetical protein N7512_008508 [Penicillium capsulatum]
MQGLWSRAAAAQSSCRCVSCLSTTASSVTSRSATAASKRRLRIGNSVTALYTSIFAAAALADARSKTQRRHDWEEKIAAVKAETNELVDEEKRIIESLQSRQEDQGVDRLFRARGLGNVTNLAPVMRRNTMPSWLTRSFHTERSVRNAATGSAPEGDLVEEGRNTETDEEEHFDSSWLFYEPLRVKAIQKLALRQFAIRLLLRPTVAQQYSGLARNHPTDFEVPDINVQGLLDELNNLRLRITKIKSTRDSNYDHIVHENVTMSPEEIRQRSRSLDTELFGDLESFISQQMSVQELILRVSTNLLNSVDPDRTFAFRRLIITFTQARQNDLNDLLLRTIIPYKFFLSNSLITTILAFYRKTKNLKDFDMFLQMLSGGGYEVNLGRIGSWEREKINGVDVDVPPLDSNNPVLYAELIRSALRFDQPDRADAWLQAARKTGFFDNFQTLSSYILFYSIRQDWERGVSTLRRAIAYLVSSTILPSDLVERLVVLMAHLCDSCDQKTASTALISAAVHSGFDPRLPEQQTDVAPIVDPAFERWAEAARSAPKENVDRPIWQKCSDFAHSFGAHLDEYELSENDSRKTQLANFAARHAQNAMSSALSFDTQRARKSSSGEQTLPGPSTSPPAKSTSNEISALREEVTQLRELVSEIRKHHIKSSFKPKSEFQKEPSYRPPKPSSASRQHRESLSVEFEHLSPRWAKVANRRRSSVSAGPT